MWRKAVTQQMAELPVPQAALPTVEQPLRVAEFDELFATAVRPVERVDLTGLRVHLPAGDAITEYVTCWAGRTPRNTSEANMNGRR